MTRKQRRPELRILSRKAGSQFYVKARLKGRAFCLPRGTKVQELIPTAPSILPVRCSLRYEKKMSVRQAVHRFSASMFLSGTPASMAWRLLALTKSM
jgi:hypothetical protein